MNNLHLGVAATLLMVTSAAALPPTPRSSVTVDAIGSGGYQATYYTSPAPISPEIHLLGVYETHSGHSFDYHPPGAAQVTILGNSNVPVHLVLSSYEPVNWTLAGPSVSKIASVLINSYYPGTVSGISAAKVINRTGVNSLGAYGYAWPSSSGGSNTPLLVNKVQTLLGAPISTFSGAYSASKFTVQLQTHPIPEPSGSAIVVGLIAVMCRRRRFSKLSN